MRVLVVVASRHGSTEEIGSAVCEGLRRRGIDAQVSAPDAVHEPADYDGFVIGSAVYAGSWMSEAREFVEAHCLDGGAFGIAEHEEPVGERTEERARLDRAGGDDQIDSCIGAAELFEHPAGGTQDPRTLVGVRVEDDRREMEGGQPFHDRAGLPEPTVDEWREDEICRELLADLRRDGACGVGSRVGHGRDRSD